MIFHVLDNLCIQPLDNVIIVYHHTLDIEQLIHSKYPFIHLVKLDKQTSGASETVKIGISQLKHLLHKKTLLLDCDTIYTTDIISEFRSTKLSTVFYTVKDTLEPPLYSYNRIIDIAEKVKISANANTGAYGFVEVEKLLQYCETNTLTYNNEPYTSCVIKTMINNGEEFYGKELDPRTIISVGTPKELTHYLETTHAYLFDLDGIFISQFGIIF
jgi:dTDP-glucose pyrophosphorylase